MQTIDKNGNKNPWIEEEQTIQWPKQKVQKDKHDESCGDIDKHGESCDDLDKHGESCGDLDKHGESCGDLDCGFLIKEKQCINEPNYMNI